MSHAESNEAALRSARPAGARERKRSGTAQMLSTNVGRRVRRDAVIIAVLTVLAITATACGGSEPDPHPAGSPSITSTSPTPSPTPTKNSDAWRSKFNAKQLKAYDAALQRWADYENRSEPIWAKGKATPEAKALFKEYFPSPAWIGVWNTLETYQQVEVKLEGTPKIYWSRLKSITSADTRLVIRQCIDYRTMTTTQYGKSTKPVASRQRPVLREVILYRVRGHRWLIDNIDKTPGAGKTDKPCDPDL